LPEILGRVASHPALLYRVLRVNADVLPDPPARDARRGGKRGRQDERIPLSEGQGQVQVTGSKRRRDE
jgi:hypothetical protein